MVRRQRSAAERRRFARVAEDVVVGCNPLARPALEARTLNFSAGGVLFLAPEPLEAGSHVALRLQLPGETEEVAFEARVVRVRTRSNTSHEVAAEFVGGDAASQRSLLAFIESKAGYQPDPFPRISA